VTLLSDGETYVSISNTRAPAKFALDVVKLLPGDYEVVGRRRGYRDVVIALQLRSATAPPVLTVICTQPIGP